MPTHLIDTHAHLDFKEFDDDRAEVIERAFKVGVDKIINIGCDEDSFKSTLELATGHDNIYAVIGLHPHEALTLNRDGQAEQEIDRIIKRIFNYTSYKKLVGIGEIGLDFYRIAREEHSNQKTLADFQQALFEAQIDLAIKAKLPIIIHCREAYPELIATLKKFTPQHNLKGVVHSFEGDYSVARQFIDLGFKISFNGMITYDRTRDSITAVKKIPLDEIMIETDAPYLTPVPLRGQRNEPAFVEYVAKRIAEIKECTFEEVARQTTENAMKFFNLT